MSIPDLPPPILVEDDQGMARLMEDMEGRPDIAVDTEADAFFSYRQVVCLIQITVGDNDYIVDPQADMDVSPLGRMFADPKRVKIFHDSEYDVLILRRAFRFDFAALFDTRVAAAVLGIQSPGLASVLESRFGVKLDKSMQRSDWSTRRSIRTSGARSRVRATSRRASVPCCASCTCCANRSPSARTFRRSASSTTRRC